jgi:hypothetical protein
MGIVGLMTDEWPALKSSIWCTGKIGATGFTALAGTSSGTMEDRYETSRTDR